MRSFLRVGRARPARKGGFGAGGTADAVHDGRDIGRTLISAPRDMAVRPHQHEAGLIECRHIRVGERDFADGHATRLCGTDKSRDIGRLGAKP